MSRPAKSVNRKPPKYRLHKASGCAVVTIHGEDIYLGKYDSPESHEKYHRLILEKWNQKSSVPTAEQETICVTTLAVDYIKHAQSYYQKNGEPTPEVGVAKLVMKRLRTSYATLNPVDFGPKRFQAFRQGFIDDGLARKTINHYMWHVLQMFRHGGRNELVPMDLYRNLKAVGNLMEGRSEARETDDVIPVDDGILAKTIEELSPILADMIRLQLLTGMRPGEVRMLRPCDIDRSDTVWRYKPPLHKNQHKKSRRAKIRIVCMGPQAQDILAKYLLRDHAAFCFSPCEVDSKRGKKPFYDKDSYRKAIERAALRVNPYPKKIQGNRKEEKAWRDNYCWSPNQVRHNAGTLARKVGGLETAQQILGHTQARTTEINYAEIDQERAVEYAKKFG